ncbi:MAG: hypothetical protein IJI14_00375 [Anaerolineaceae bacterium]|nr:hypothetical protein [Anaerolineaceae bacterium]
MTLYLFVIERTQDRRKAFTQYRHLQAASEEKFPGIFKKIIDDERLMQIKSSSDKLLYSDSIL